MKKKRKNHGDDQGQILKTDFPREVEIVKANAVYSEGRHLGKGSEQVATLGGFFESRVLQESGHALVDLWNTESYLLR